MFEIAGTNRVFGPPQKLARQIVQSAARLGVEVNAAFAANPDAALTVAKGRSGISIVPSGEEPQCLSLLPVDVLSPTTEQAEIFDAWGIRTCGDLAALPEVPLVERLGQEGLRLHTLARGQAQRSLIAVDPPQRIEERIELEDFGYGSRISGVYSQSAAESDIREAARTRCRYRRNPITP